MVGGGSVGCTNEDVCSLRCGRLCVSPSELRKTFREGVPVSDTQIREVKAGLQLRPCTFAVSMMGRGGKTAKLKGES